MIKEIIIALVLLLFTVKFVQLVFSVSPHGPEYRSYEDEKPEIYDPIVADVPDWKNMIDPKNQ